MEIPGYTIESRIGTGGQATVYRAVQESLGRPVALKVLNPEYAGDSAFTHRFLNEGRILANLKHSHVITIHDIGVHGDYHFLSMELVEGGDLKARIRQGLEPDEVLDYVAIIADCLATAHAMNVVHRDIKPANVLFRRDGTLLLTDFGIAKRLDVDGDLTLAGATMGSPGYLSPEQAQNLPLDGRADLYSLGAMAFEMLTGRKPYTADSDYTTIHKHVSAPLPELPPELGAYQELIDRTMAKTPQDRFANAKALVDYLRELRPQVPVRTPSPPPESPPSEKTGYTITTLVTATGPEVPRDTLVEGPVHADSTTPVNEGMKDKREARAAGVMLALGALAVTGSVLWWLLTRPASEEAPMLEARLDGSDEVASRPGETTPDGAVALSAPTHEVELDGSGMVEPPAEALTAPDGPRVARTAPLPDAVATEERAHDTAPESDAEAGAAPGPVARAPAPASVEPAAGELERDPRDAERVRELLAAARKALTELRLTVPERDNAVYYYDRVLVLDPDHPEALAASQHIAGRYAELARGALDKGDPSRARALLARGLRLDAGHAELLAVSEELDAQAREAPIGASSRDGSSPTISGESPRQLYRRVKRWFD